MDHRPYEDWLLDDVHLAPEQDRDMRIHLRNCPECNALARANLSLRSAAVVTPVKGFALRFQTRLVTQNKTQRRQTLIGLFLLAAVSTGGLLWLFFPYLPFLALSPVELVSLWISNLVYIMLTVRALGALGDIFFGILSSLIPMYVWVFSLAVLAGIGFLWTVSFRRVGKIAQSTV